MWLLALALVADTVHTFSLALSPAESVEVTVTGTGDPVVLVPGLFGSAFGYRAVIPLLTGAGYRAIVVEPLGIGSSARPQHADYSLTAQADRIAAALDRLSVRQAIVVAHSLGASMAFRLAYRRPYLVAGLVRLAGGPAEGAATRAFRRAMKLAPWIRLFGGVKLVRKKIRGQLMRASGDASWVSERVVDEYTAGAAHDLDGTLKAFLAMAERREPERLRPHLREVRCPVRLLLGTATHEGGVSAEEVAVLAAALPETGSIYGFRVQVVDSAGHALPDEMIHHFNLIDPDHRELFLPISRRLLAAGHETGAIRLPRLLFGLPLNRGEHVVASAMVENLTPVAYHGARVRLVMSFTPAKRPWPLFSASPWQMDVAFPVGDKSFTLPPGRSSRSYEGSPAVPGTIVGLGGHMHDYGRVIEFADVTTGEVIYRAAPVADLGGHIESIPIAMLFGWTPRAVHIVPEHRYRIAVSYDNPTGAPIPDGGMGVVGGLFVPDRGVSWPAADPADSLYQKDYRH